MLVHVPWNLSGTTILDVRKRWHLQTGGLSRHGQFVWNPVVDRNWKMFFPDRVVFPEGVVSDRLTVHFVIVSKGWSHPSRAISYFSVLMYMPCEIKKKCRNSIRVLRNWSMILFLDGLKEYKAVTLSAAIWHPYEVPIDCYTDLIVVSWNSAARKSCVRQQDTFLWFDIPIYMYSETRERRCPAKRMTSKRRPLTKNSSLTLSNILLSMGHLFTKTTLPCWG